MKLIPAAVALAVMLLAQPLLAHTKLSSSNPADGSTVNALPEIQLEFSAAVRLTAVILESSAGAEVGLGPIPGETATAYTIALKDVLAPGEYLITWRSVSGDSHIVSGEIRFSVAD